MSIARRPNRSASGPAMAIANVAPTVRQLTNQPSESASSVNSAFTGSMVPEMTALSNPMRNPPNATTSDSLVA
jgi:hypothetical protein